jgi:hypothetical protein
MASFSTKLVAVARPPSPGGVPLPPFVPTETLNEALIAAGYPSSEAVQIEENDLNTPGYGSQPGQYPVITDPALDPFLPGYGGNVGGQLFDVQQQQESPMVEPVTKAPIDRITDLEKRVTTLEGGGKPAPLPIHAIGPAHPVAHGGPIGKTTFAK